MIGFFYYFKSITMGCVTQTDFRDQFFFFTLVDLRTDIGNMNFGKHVQHGVESNGDFWLLSH